LYEDYDQFSVYRSDATADLLSRLAERFAQRAPACSNGAASTSRASSRFVRVRRKKVPALAFARTMPSVDPGTERR
jgi:hypothetical protein